MTGPAAGAPAAFLDRDGVLNVDLGYVYRPEDLRLTPTAAAAVGELNRRGYRVVVLTNQSGVARGLFGTAEVEAFHAHLTDRLAAEGARIDAFYYCPYHVDGIVAQFARAHEDRKPAPGMILRAMRDHAIPAAGSFLVGDKASDMAAAAAAGIPGLLVPTDVPDLLSEITRFLDTNPGRSR